MRALAAAALLAALGTTGAPSAAAAAAPVPAVPTPAPPVAPVTDAQADRLSALVAAEDDRLLEVRRLVQQYQAPFRVRIAGAYTLVLTARPEPYTLEDLLRLAPQTVEQGNDGVVLVSEHLVVAGGATLHLARPGGLTVRLASGPSGFVSLAGVGGRVELEGAPGAPVRVTSWDVRAAAPDTDPSDGRSYVRALGGALDLTHVQASDLGFWSGRTGGLAATGTDRDVTAVVQPAVPGAGGAGTAGGGTTVQSAGPLTEGAPPRPRNALPDLSRASARVTDTVVDRDAFGLFVSGADDLVVTRTVVRHGLTAGVVVHRDVTSGRITATTSTDNAGDGFHFDRGSSGVALRGVVASRNSGNGVTLTGRPLADGPSATGAPTRSSGDNRVTDSTIEDNAGDGVEVAGGQGLRVERNQVRRNGAGVQVSGPADDVLVADNALQASRGHGIAVVDGVTRAHLQGNVVDGAGDGLYVRDSSARLDRNAVRHLAGHGITLVGRVDGTELSDNSLTGTGHGTVPVDRLRATGPVTDVGTQLVGWQDRSWHRWTRLLLHPMNALWLAIGLLLLLSARQGRRHGAAVVHPYAHQMAHQGSVVLPVPDGPSEAEVATRGRHRA